jgi:hypothetical protein
MPRGSGRESAGQTGKKTFFAAEVRRFPRIFGVNQRAGDANSEHLRKSAHIRGKNNFPVLDADGVRPNAIEPARHYVALC